MGVIQDNRNHLPLIPRSSLCSILTISNPELHCMWGLYRPLNDILLLTFIAVIIKIHSIDFLTAVTIDFIFSYVLCTNND